MDSQNANSDNPSADQLLEQQLTTNECDMNYESNRLRTFEAVWLILYIFPEVLARYGFYFSRSPDYVQCHFCNIQVYAWEEGDEVIAEHLRWSPYCPLMQKQPTQNVPLDPHFLDSVPDPPPDVTSYHSGPYEPGSDPRRTTSIRPCSPMYSEYARESERLKSFAGLSSTMSQKSSLLSDAGFFYTGKGDEVRCYYCGGGLKHWEPNDDPWKEHAMWYRNCKYLQQMKDRSFIERCLAKKKGIKNTGVPDTSESVVYEATPRQVETVDSYHPKTSDIKRKLPTQNESFDPYVLDSVPDPTPHTITGASHEHVRNRNPEHPEYEPESKRLRSLADWPSTMPEAQNANINKPSVNQSVEKQLTTNEHDMNYERNRLRTFEAGWLNLFIFPEVLARYGFYFTSSPDNVKCHFCEVQVGAWEQGDDVIAEHLRWSQYCPLMRKRPTQNVPLDPHFLDSVPNPTPDVTSYRSALYEPVSSTSRQYDSVPFCRPEYPEYALESERLKSFADWPSAMPLKPPQFSEAGFFYTGKGDQVRCYYCGGELKHWEPNDDPWEQHAMCFSNCKYLQQMKDRSFIERCVAMKESRNKKEVEVPSSSKSPTSVAAPRELETWVSDDTLCKICYESDYGTAFIPCGHVTCRKCALSVEKCPMCQSPILEMQKLYLF